MSEFEELEKQCEELKEEIALGGGALSDKIRATIFTDLQQENDRYKQALETIKNICDEMDGIYPLSQDILDIINEVKERNNNES